MKFPWMPKGRGDYWPLLPVGFRRNGKILPVNPALLVDTGADGTVLNVGLAAGLGFKSSDLAQESSKAIGGQAIVYVPSRPDLGEIQIQIGRTWFPLPSLRFGVAPVSLLGRDLIFSNFELRMTPSEFELIPLRRRR
jgi:hypothetical protein